MSQLENSDYLQTLISLKERILQAQYNSYSAVNSEMILAYLDIGKTISEKTKTGWGTSVIMQLSVDLQAEFIGAKGFSERNLRRNAGKRNLATGCGQITLGAYCNDFQQDKRQY